MKALLSTVLVTGVLLAGCTATSTNSNTAVSNTNSANSNTVVTNTNGSENENTNTPAIYANWKPIIDRSKGIELKLPQDWSARLTLVAPEGDFIPGRNFIGLYAPGATQDFSMRLDVFSLPMAKVRQDNPYMNGTYGSVAKEEEVQIDGKTWTKIDYRVTAGSGEMPQIQYITEFEGKTYSTGYSVEGDTTIPEAIVQSISLGN